MNDRQTIDITPDWEKMRRFVLHVFKTDPVSAHRIATEMGDEAPKLPDKFPANYGSGMHTHTLHGCGYCASAGHAGNERQAT